MTYSVLSTHTFAVLGDFDDENAAQEAVYESLSAGGAAPDDIMVMVHDETGTVVEDIQHEALVAWAGAQAAEGSLT